MRPENETQKQTTFTRWQRHFLAEVELLKKQVYNLQMEYDILEKAAQIVKKGQGMNPGELASAEKAKVIDALREVFPLKEL